MTWPPRGFNNLLAAAQATWPNSGATDRSTATSRLLARAALELLRAARVKSEIAIADNCNRQGWDVAPRLVLAALSLEDQRVDEALSSFSKLAEDHPKNLDDLKGVLDEWDWIEDRVFDLLQRTARRALLRSNDLQAFVQWHTIQMFLIERFNCMRFLAPVSIAACALLLQSKNVEAATDSAKSMAKWCRSRVQLPDHAALFDTLHAHISINSSSEQVVENSVSYFSSRGKSALPLLLYATVINMLRQQVHGAPISEESEKDIDAVLAGRQVAKHDIELDGYSISFVWLPRYVFRSQISNWLKGCFYFRHRNDASTAAQLFSDAIATIVNADDRSRGFGLLLHLHAATAFLACSDLVNAHAMLERLKAVVNVGSVDLVRAQLSLALRNSKAAHMHLDSADRDFPATCAALRELLHVSEASAGLLEQAQERLSLIAKMRRRGLFEHDSVFRIVDIARIIILLRLNRCDDASAIMICDGYESMDGAVGPIMKTLKAIVDVSCGKNSSAKALILDAESYAEKLMDCSTSALVLAASLDILGRLQAPSTDLVPRQQQLLDNKRKLVGRITAMKNL